MKASRAQDALPLAVRRDLRTLGFNIATARKRRNLTVASVAERAFVGRNTITRVERGGSGVALGIYATLLFVLGLSGQLGNIADPGEDRVGQSLEADRLPVRARTARAERSGGT